MGWGRRAAWALGCIWLAATGCTDDAMTTETELDSLAPLMGVVEMSTEPTSITELRPLPDETTSRPVAVNADGLAVGRSGARPALWAEDGTPTELPTLPAATETRPNSINDAGQIAGNVEADGRTHVVIWEDGNVTEIGTPPGYGHVRGEINSAGHIVGTATGPEPGSDPERGFVWRDGSFTLLPPLPEDEISTAVAGNAAGLVLGISSNVYEEPDDPRDEWRFVVWLAGEIIWSTDQPSPVPSGNEWWLGVSDAGDGYMINTDVGALWRWRAGTLEGWPDPDNAWASFGKAVSPRGLVLGGFFEDTFVISARGVWVGEVFFEYDGELMPDCWAVSNDGHVICEGPDHEHPFVALLDLGVEEPVSVEGILSFLDASDEDGSLRGDGPGASGPHRLNALREMLLLAKSGIEDGAEPDEVCGQLRQVLRRTDGSIRPPDFATGPAAASLADRVRALLERIGCP